MLWKCHIKIHIMVTWLFSSTDSWLQELSPSPNPTLLCLQYSVAPLCNCQQRCNLPFVCGRPDNTEHSLVQMSIQRLIIYFIVSTCISSHSLSLNECIHIFFRQFTKNTLTTKTFQWQWLLTRGFFWMPGNEANCTIYSLACLWGLRWYPLTYSLVCVWGLFCPPTLPPCCSLLYPFHTFHPFIIPLHTFSCGGAMH